MSIQRKVPSRKGEYPLDTSLNASDTTSTSALNSSNQPFSNSTLDSGSDSRRRQAHRDESIRRKINTSLSKRGIVDSPKSRQPQRPPPGTVLSLRPSPPLTMKHTSTVFEAARLMAAKRENCVLVVDDEESVCGIFTAKDLAFRVVGSGLDPKDVVIEQIMTRNPMCARTDTSATEALSLMVSEGFRHLPVIDENQDIAGVLDITKCFHEAMDKLERAYNSSRKFHNALEGVQIENGMQTFFNNPQKAAQLINYIETLKEKMEGPDLSTVLDDAATMPVFVSSKTNAAEAARLMKERNTTAVLVTDSNQITGIVTSKDIVLRVIAAGFNPKICSLVRVMTPQPDFAPLTMTIQNALRQMYQGNYLNLPVMSKTGEIVGIVDVLTLTYATLEQINSISTSDSDGPAWQKFWTSFDDHESDNSGANSNFARSNTPGGTSARNEPVSPTISAAEFAEFDILDHEPYLENDQDLQSLSQFQVDDDPFGELDQENSVPFPFKFKSPAGRVYRITVSPTDGLNFLREQVTLKLNLDELKLLGGESEYDDDGMLVSHGFCISYLDDDGDIVAITSDTDLVEAISIYRELGKQTAELFVHHSDEHLAKPFEEQGRDESPEKESRADLVPGIANELILPGALVMLATSILVVFAFSRHR